jgi:hypothetical protein
MIIILKHIYKPQKEARNNNTFNTLKQVLCSELSLRAKSEDGRQEEETR